MTVGTLMALRGSLEALRLRASGCFSPQVEALQGEQSLPSKGVIHESAIKRQIYRALHELERRQAARGKPPEVVDCGVSGMPEETRRRDRSSSRLRAVWTKLINSRNKANTQTLSPPSGPVA